MCIEISIQNVSLLCRLQLESEATHRAVTIANRVRGLSSPSLQYHALYVLLSDEFPSSSTQARCPIYLVNVSSMSAGDMIAAAKMQGGGTAMRRAPSFWRRHPYERNGDFAAHHTRTHAHLSTSLQAKWSTQRPPWLTPCSTGRSTTTRTGLTPPPTSSSPHSASTPTRPATSWVSWPSTCSLKAPFYFELSSSRRGCLSLQLSIDDCLLCFSLQWHPERRGIGAPSIQHQAESPGQGGLHEDPSRSGRRAGQDERDLGEGGGTCAACVSQHPWLPFSFHFHVKICISFIWERKEQRKKKKFPEWRMKRGRKKRIILLNLFALLCQQINLVKNGKQNVQIK